jgi:hypothetical protein
MKKKLLVLMAFVAIFTLGSQAQSLSNMASAVSSKGTEATGLAQEIMKAANVDEKQAMGGAGALFGMAQENMEAKDFSNLTESIPDVNKMMDVANSFSGKTSMLGTAATALTGMPKVKSTFKKMGISEDKIALFTPVLVNYVEKNGSKLLGSKLSSALGM